MIAPDKHISLASSLLGLGSFVLGVLKETPKVSLDELWRLYGDAYGEERYPGYHSFDNMILAVDFLYSLGAVELQTDGDLVLCAS